MSGEVRHLSVTIARDWRAFYEEIWRPEIFPRWAHGLSNATLRQEGGVWHARGPGGDVTIRFSAHNDLGVMDHWVTTPAGEVYVPLRVVANGVHAEVTLTLLRQPEMNDTAFAADAAAVTDDLARLRTLAEG